MRVVGETEASLARGRYRRCPSSSTENGPQLLIIYFDYLYLGSDLYISFSRAVAEYTPLAAAASFFLRCTTMIVKCYSFYSRSFYLLQNTRRWLLPRASSCDATQ